MTDLEITRACAEAMGYEAKEWSIFTPSNTIAARLPHSSRWDEYNPLHDDAQAMALVKRFGLVCDPQHDGQDFAADPGWEVSHPSTGDELFISPDLNRAICEAVAKMHREQA
jgi:hypothetical protein